MKKVRFGIIGAGGIANHFCDAVKLVENAEVISVSSKSEEKARSFAERNGIASYYGSYDEMLSRNDIDAVYIATTHNFHFENIMQSLRAGKHVICEKPFVLDPEDAKTAFEYGESRGLFVMEAMWSRFLPHIRKAKEWIAEGMIGQCEFASAVIGWKDQFNPQSRIWNPDLAGGALYDVGVYPLEIMTYLIPEKLTDVHSEVTYAETGVDKVSHVSLKFDNCIASVFASVSASTPEPTSIYGTDGRIEMLKANVGDTAVLYRNGKEKIEFTQPYENGFTFEIEEAVRCINEGLLESPVIPHADTVAVAEIFTKVLGK